MTRDDIRLIDRSGMFERIKDFPNQVREAVEIARSARIRIRAQGVRSIVLSGLGGSAIGGDLLRSYLANDLGVPFVVNRHYTLPAFVGRDTLVILSSYSGNTEETVAAHHSALKRRAKLLCVSSNGTTKRLARRHKSTIITVPGGLPPRAALGYSFFPLLIALTRMGFIADRDRDIADTISLLASKSREYSSLEPGPNRALQLAERLQGRVGIIYSSTEHFDAVSTRWRGQMAENAKTLTFGHVLPEMNHNEIVGWKVLTEQMRDMQVFLLRDRGDHRRVKMRLDVTKEILASYTPRVTEIWSEGSSLLTRVFSLVYLGDWVSYYLAILNREDPTPVTAIDYLKKELGKL
ncbi:MAG: bifunctional phosphoglucose/phosphomannose isomerase [Bacteroidetes bacterium]|nr:bifunctional phosphoglucose/phosphomannose isomerase [Bacteroidota bacterium]